jgi:hypothetical protein
MGWECGTYRQKWIQAFDGGGILKGRDHLQDVGVDGRIKSGWILKMG